MNQQIMLFYSIVDFFIHFSIHARPVSNKGHNAIQAIIHVCVKGNIWFIMLLQITAIHKLLSSITAQQNMVFINDHASYPGFVFL